MTEYLIFARREYQQPLEWIGTLSFDGDPFAPLSGPAREAELDRRARERFGSEWLEMIAVPRPAALQVIPME